MIKAVIFDMDGVLVNTTEASLKAVNILLKDYGFHFSEEEFKQYTGVSTENRLELWEKKYGLKIKDNEKFKKDFIEIQLDLVKEKLKPDQELIELIEGIKKKNVRVAVATAALSFKAETILKSIGVLDLLDVLVTGDNIKNHKPDPEVYLKTAKELDISPEECLVVEDSVVGIQAAKNSEMEVVWLVTKLFSKKELKEADYIISNLNEFKYEWLE